MHLVLSLDGGGVRCVMQIVLLSRLVERLPYLLDAVTVFAGTSGGSFLALALANDGLASAMQVFSEDNVRKIFSEPWGVAGGYGLWRPRFSPHALQSILRDMYGSAELGDLKRRVFVPTFDLNGEVCKRDASHHNCGVQHWTPCFAHNFPDSDHLQEELVEVAMRSSAAPTYFPSRGEYVDGGVVANNPSAQLIAKLVQQGVPLEEICVLSIGTGNAPYHVEPEQSQVMGLSQWATHIVDLLMDAPAEGSVVMSKNLLGARFHRCNPELEAPIDLSDASQFAKLVRIAYEFDLEPTVAYLEKHWFPELQGLQQVNFTI